MSGIRIQVVAIRCPHCTQELAIDREREFANEEEQALYVEAQIADHTAGCGPAQTAPCLAVEIEK